MNYREHAIRYATQRGWEHVEASLTSGRKRTQVFVDEFHKGGKVVVATFMHFPALTDWSTYWTMGHYDFGSGRCGRIEAVQSAPGQKQWSLERALDEPA
ncbi:hypothetical protein [Streptomyces sp. C1-2]|uniref:hypothetical protein n=1 Tax=Streptomyces sp. C1-2 TaxID=2720022 RepID=UPI0014323983|nr:hypothetical protein [Streptomyces sp. C1-2]NJP74337.1 hypothetical protein [Streptomyces sp. C1-2]